MSGSIVGVHTVQFGETHFPPVWGYPDPESKIQDQSGVFSEEKMDNREKAATNVAQLTMKEVGGPRQTCPRCLIFYLYKVQKPRGKKRKHREEP